MIIFNRKNKFQIEKDKNAMMKNQRRARDLISSSQDSSEDYELSKLSRINEVLGDIKGKKLV